MNTAPVFVSGNRQGALENARRRMGKFFRDNQVLGRRNAIGCVAEGRAIWNPLSGAMLPVVNS